MRDPCDVRVFIQSRLVVADARILRFRMPVPAMPIGLAFLPVTVVELERRWRLDANQAEGLRQARRLAEDAGMPLRVVDLGRMNPIARLLRWALLGGRSLPVVVIHGSCAWKLARGKSEVPLAIP